MDTPQDTHPSYSLGAVQSVHKGFTHLYTCQVQHTRFNGEKTGALHREVTVHKPVAAVLPYNPFTEEIVLIEQFRIGACPIPTPATSKAVSKTARVHPWLLELIAGYIDTSETPEQAAHRESKEEANLEITSLIPIHQYWVSPGISTAYIHLFCAKLTAKPTLGVCGLEAEEEDIRVHSLPVAQAWQALQAGKITNGVTLIGLQWLQLHYQTIRERYLSAS